MSRTAVVAGFLAGGVLGAAAGFALGIFVYPYIFLADIVAMDQVIVDVGDATVAVGDRAILFGDPATGVPSATEWADAAETINYEIVTRLGGRIQRRYSDGA